MQNQSSAQNHSPTQKYKDSFNFFQRRRFSAQSKVLPPSRILGQKAQLRDRRRIFPVQVLPPSRILGQKARFPCPSAPTVPYLGTEGAFTGQKARFPRQSAPTVPYFGTEGAVYGTEGAFFPPKCSHRPGFRDRRRSWGLYMCNFGGCRRI